jgi:hypothetical protein
VIHKIVNGKARREAQCYRMWQTNIIGRMTGSRILSAAKRKRLAQGMLAKYRNAKKRIAAEMQL